MAARPRSCWCTVAQPWGEQGSGVRAACPTGLWGTPKWGAPQVTFQLYSRQEFAGFGMDVTRR